MPLTKQAQLERLGQEDQYRSLAGYQLLNTGMTLLGQTGFRLSRLEFTPRGKPRYPVPVGFSLSHAGDLVTCALLPDGETGIDTEQYHALPRPLSQYLTETELRSVRRDPRAFFDIWTRKEAVVKAGSDEGLAALSEVVLQGPNRARFRSRTWYLNTVAILPGYATHVATDRSVEINLMQVPLT